MYLPRMHFPCPADHEQEDWLQCKKKACTTDCSTSICSSSPEWVGGGITSRFICCADFREVDWQKYFFCYSGFHSGNRQNVLSSMTIIYCTTVVVPVGWTSTGMVAKSAARD